MYRITVKAFFTKGVDGVSYYDDYSKAHAAFYKFQNEYGEHHVIILEYNRYKTEWAEHLRYISEHNKKMEQYNQASMQREADQT